MANTNVKLNRSGNSHAGYTIRVITHGYFGDVKLSALERVITNALYSFAQKGKAAKFTFSEISKRYHVSYSTISRTIPKILRLAFERADEPHSYKLRELLPPPKLYFYIPDWLRFAQFPTQDGTTDLTNDQIEVLSYIIHQNKELRHWTSTQASIARMLEIAPSTVSAAIALFEELHILTVKCADPTRSRSANHFDRARFELNHELLKKTRLETLQHVKAVSKAVRGADSRTDRERFYEARQKLANSHAETIRKALGEDYKKLERQLGVLKMQLSKAEHEKRMDDFKKIYERRKEIKDAMHIYLIQHGFNEADLEPRYLCPLCNDTGWDLKTQKACSCYTPPGGTP